MIVFGEKRPDPVFAKDVGLNPDDTWIVFGCSPFINEVKKYIPELIQTYRNIGCNAFPRRFKGCEYLITIDQNNFIETHRDSKFILGTGKNDALYRKYHKEVEIDYVFQSEPEEPVLKDTFQWIDRDNFEFKPGRLLCRHTIALPAVNYALLQGAKNVVLIGVDLSSGWQHFYDKNPKSIDIRKAHHRKHRQKRMITCLHRLSRHVNIYNLNPLNETEMPIIDVKELLG